MNYSVLGQVYRGEQSPGIPFWRYIDPTEFDKAAASIVDQINQYHTGIDLLNPKLWLCIGPFGSPVAEFLKGYIQIASERKEAVSPENLNSFQLELLNRFDIKPYCSDEYFRALMDLYNAGQIPDVIFKPWGYVPEEPIESLIKASEYAGSYIGTKGIANKIIIAGALVAGAYLLIPRLVKQTRQKPRRREDYAL